MNNWESHIIFELLLHYIIIFICTLNNNTNKAHLVLLIIISSEVHSISSRMSFFTLSKFPYFLLKKHNWPQRHTLRNKIMEMIFFIYECGWLSALLSLNFDVPEIGNNSLSSRVQCEWNFKSSVLSEARWYFWWRTV